MSIQDEFTAATVRAKSLPKQSNEALLQLYGLYKQATEGDVTGEAPGFFDLRAQAKFDAWEERRGMSTDAAMKAYVELVSKLGG